jgi:hypothetical protein
MASLSSDPSPAIIALLPMKQPGKIGCDQMGDGDTEEVINDYPAMLQKK